MALGFTGRCKKCSNESHYMLAIKCDTFLQSPLGGTASCPQPTEWDRPPNTQKNAEIKEVACEFLVFASCMWISLAPPQSGLFSAGEERVGLGEISAPSAKFYLYASLGIIDAVQVFKNHYTAFHWKKNIKHMMEIVPCTLFQQKIKIWRHAILDVQCINMAWWRRNINEQLHVIR